MSLVSDLQKRLKVINPLFVDIDSTKFDGWSIDAVNLALKQMQANYIDSANIFARSSTLSGTAPVSGSPIIDTTIGDTYEVTLVTGAVKVAGDTIWVYNPTSGEYKTCPRVSIDAILVGGTGETIFGFYEVKGAIVIYMKNATFTTVPFKVQYDYWRKLTAVTTTSDALDILDTDFDTFVSLANGYMPQA